MSKPERPSLKIKLKRTLEAEHAAEVVEFWRNSKSAAVNVTKAIRMYYQLTIGDTTLLREYFPFLEIARPVNETPTTADTKPARKKAPKKS